MEQEIKELELQLATLYKKQAEEKAKKDALKPAVWIIECSCSAPFGSSGSYAVAAFTSEEKARKCLYSGTYTLNNSTYYYTVKRFVLDQVTSAYDYLPQDHGY